MYYGLAFLVLAAFGSYGVFVRWSGLAGKEQYIVFWRVLIGLAIVVPFILITRQSRQLKINSHYVLLFATGVVVALQAYTGSKAMNLLPVSDALFIIYLAPVLVAASAPLVLKEKLEGGTIAALAIAIGGLAVISFAGRGGSAKSLNMSGVLFALVAAVCYAVMILTIKILRESVPALAVYFYQALTVLVVTLPFAGWRLPPGITGKGWAALFVIGAFHSALLSLAYVYIAKRVKAQHLGVISYVEPVSSTLFAFLLLGETPGWQNYVGGALIIAAGIIVLMRGTVAPVPDERL